MNLRRRVERLEQQINPGEAHLYSQEEIDRAFEQLPPEDVELIYEATMHPDCPEGPIPLDDLPAYLSERQREAFHHFAELLVEEDFRHLENHYGG